MNRLAKWAETYGTDKQKYNYPDIYFKHLKGRKVKHLLEIGVQGGKSMRMWREFFPHTTRITGIDIDPKCLDIDINGVDIHIGDQADVEFLNSLMRKVPKFDMVIDDGGHTMQQQIQSFVTLFPHVEKGGVYVIEDLQTSYKSNFMQDVDEWTKLVTGVEFLKDLIDDVNNWGQDYNNGHELVKGRKRKYPDITSLTFHNGLCFIRK